MAKAERVNEPHRLGSWRPSPLMVRILSGTVILAVALGLLYAGYSGIAALAVLIAAASLYEFTRLSDRLGFRAPLWLIYPLGFYFTFEQTLLKKVDVQLVLSLSLVGGLAAFLFLPGRRQGLGRWAMGMTGALYIGLPLNYYLLLYNGGHSRGLAWLLTVLAAAVMSDVAALLVGMRFGRTPFFASISPRKTLEGAIGGMVVAIVVFLLFGVAVLGIPAGHSLVLGLLVGLSAEAGDLVESQMKRLAGVKDSSGLIPGHGGVLDRIDSLLFPPIVIYIYALGFGLLR